jgi:hypothetical protein
MEETKPVKTGAGESLSEQEATSISGGESSATVSTPVIGVTAGSYPDPGAALVAIYEGFVDVTSHVIERVVNGVKS